MKEPIKELQAQVIAGDTIILSQDNLVSFTISIECGILTTGMRRLEAKFIGNQDLIDKLIHPSFSIKLSSGNYESLDFGSFKVTEINYIKDTNETTIVAYDLMINAMKKYEK